MVTFQLWSKTSPPNDQRIGRKSATIGFVAFPRTTYPQKFAFLFLSAFALTSSQVLGAGPMSDRYMNISTLPTMVTPMRCAAFPLAAGGTGPRGGGHVPTSYTTSGMSESRLIPKFESSG